MKARVKRRLYPAVAGLAIAGFLVWLFSQFQISIEVQPDASVPIPASPEPAATPIPSPPALVLPTATPIASPTGSPSVAALSSPSQSPARLQGSLRVSNQTDHPVRLALIQQATEANAPTNAYQEPVHWDFSPQEGSMKGLLLALPDRDLLLRSGDIIAAFAQDGSRRYWGPYVVGKTPLPRWDEASKEWQLLLESP